MARPPPVILPAGGGVGHAGAADGRDARLCRGRRGGGPAAHLRPLAHVVRLQPVLQVAVVREQAQGEAPHHPSQWCLCSSHAATPSVHVQGRDLHQSR